MKKTCDCIVPFYNEGLNPFKVIGSLIKVRSISKIIAVDDGSDTDSMYVRLKTNFPQITSIRLKTNGGKANAVKEGLKYVQAEYVFLVDGDLTNVISKEIENAIQKISGNPGIDMIILHVVTDIMKSDPFRLYTILSGQRVLRKYDLETLYRNKFSGFQIESAINDYMVKKNKNTYWMPSSLHNLSKYRKWGKFEGTKRIFTLFKEVADYIGWRNFIWQILFFCKKEAP